MFFARIGYRKIHILDLNIGAHEWLASCFDGFVFGEGTRYLFLRGFYALELVAKETEYCRD
jgi:hypothetical protein